jgi:integrase
VVRQCFTNIRAITHLAKKQKFLGRRSGEDVTMPQTKPVEKPVMTREQILALIGAIEDVQDLCLLQVGIFCGLRASEIMGCNGSPGLERRSCLTGRRTKGSSTTDGSRPGKARRPFRFRSKCDLSLKLGDRSVSRHVARCLMFPTFGRGERKGQAVPRWGKNFLKWRIRPVARKVGIPDHLITFQVMRRTLGTDMQKHGTLKDTQGMLRHASIKTTGDVYVQPSSKACWTQ